MEGEGDGEGERVRGEGGGREALSDLGEEGREAPGDMEVGRGRRLGEGEGYFSSSSSYSGRMLSSCSWMTLSSIWSTLSFSGLNLSSSSLLLLSSSSSSSLTPEAGRVTAELVSRALYTRQ